MLGFDTGGASEVIQIDSSCLLTHAMERIDGFSC